jgi:hypothetical protein
MQKLLATVFIVGLAAADLSSAQAMPLSGARLDAAGTSNITRVWDDCGHGRYRTPWGQCVSNWRPGPNGCPPGYHLGWDVRVCRPN